MPRTTHTPAKSQSLILPLTSLLAVGSCGIFGPRSSSTSSNTYTSDPAATGTRKPSRKHDCFASELDDDTDICGFSPQEIAPLIKQYYDESGEFAGTHEMFSIIMIRVEKTGENTWNVHVKYSHRILNPTSAQRAQREDSIDERIFVVRRETNTFHVASMGGHDSGNADGGEFVANDHLFQEPDDEAGSWPSSDGVTPTKSQTTSRQSQPSPRTSQEEHERRCYAMVQIGAESEISKPVDEGAFSIVEDECLSGKLKLDPNRVYLQGLSLLHAAAFFGGRRMTKLILKHGGDPAVVASNGLTAHDIASKAGHDDVASLLHAGKTDWRSWRPIGVLLADGALAPLVTSNTFLTTWAGQVTALRTTDGRPPSSNMENVQWQIEITWSGDQSPYKCGEIIFKNASAVKDATMRSLSMYECAR